MRVNLWVIVAVFSTFSFFSGIVIQATQHVLPCMGDCGCKIDSHQHDSDRDDPEPRVTPGPDV